jgi:hypothetical protein
MSRDHAAGERISTVIPPSARRVVWKEGQGSVQVKRGMPRLSELQAISGLPKQTIDAPALQRFR